MVEQIMYIGIGFLVAGLFVIGVIPLVHARAVHLTTTSSRVRRRSAPITASTTRPRPTGRRLHWGSLAAVALTTLSRSAVPRRSPAHSAQSASVARSL